MDYKAAQVYWDKKEELDKKLEKEELIKYIEEFIAKHKTCVLATGYNTDVRATPIEYNYYDGVFYLISEGGHKFDALEYNNKVSLGIYEEYVSFAECRGLQVFATVEIIDPSSPEYEDIMGRKHISMAALAKINHPMHMLKVIPYEFDMLSSDFKKMGLNTFRQKLKL